MNDHELLSVELDALWPHVRPLVAIAVSADRQSVRVAEGVPAAVRDVVERSRPLPPEREPQALRRCAELVPVPVETAAFACFWIPPGVRGTATARIVRSTDPGHDDLIAANPGNWEAQEWTDLLAGDLGPWTMALEAGRVASICHSPVWTDVAAEAGVWTDPDFRGRGLAGAVTAAWAELAIGAGRLAFYSAASWNAASQRVAAGLRLRPIGYLWQLKRPAAE